MTRTPTRTATPTPVSAPGLVIQLVDPLGPNLVAAGDVRVDIGLPPEAASETLGVFLDGVPVLDFLTPIESATGGGLGTPAGTVSGVVRDVPRGNHRIQAEVLAGPPPGVVVVGELDFEAIQTSKPTPTTLPAETLSDAPGSSVPISET